MTAAAHPLPVGKRDARAERGRPLPPEGGHRLSMVHKTSSGQTADSASADKSPQLFQIWKDGSLAMFPGIPNKDPKAAPLSGNRGGPRGKVVTLSDASRRNLMIYLAKMRRDAQGFTLTLTLPGDTRLLPSALVHLRFLKLCNRFTASRLFPAVSYVWKRELQKRGALHYHLLLYGLVNDATRRAFQRWIANQWNGLVCVGLSDEEWGKHLRWHLHAKNMEAVRGNIASYFAKYLGKALESICEEIPGRWWGKVNTKALPVAACSEMPLPAPAAVLAHRLARKLIKKRADAAKHYNLARELGMVDLNGKPYLTPFDMIAMKGGHLTGGKRFLWEVMQHSAKLKGKRWGKSRRRGFGKYSRVRLISKNSPATALQIMRQVGDALKDWVARNPF